MNCEVFELQELEVESYQIREVLRCLLHTIMFTRALGLVRPRDVDSELFDITYVQCGDPTIERKIEEKIDSFCSWVEKNPSKKGQVCLLFYEKRNKAMMAWFGSKVERLYWEQWSIPLSLAGPAHEEPPPPLSRADSPRPRSLSMGCRPASEERRRRLEAALQDAMVRILTIVNEKKDHIPPVLSAQVASFSFEISIPSAQDSAYGLDMFKRMLQTTPPHMLG